MKPSGVVLIAGVIKIDCKVAPETIIFIELEYVPKVAVIMVEPIAIGAIKPWDPEALLIVAILDVDELQIVDVVTFCVLPSVNVTVATHCWFTPKGIVAILDCMFLEILLKLKLSEKLFIVAADTVKVVVPIIFEKLAVILLEPVATGVARPWEPEILLMVAIFDEDEAHVT